jgi:hypothetical protein
MFSFVKVPQLQPSPKWLMDGNLWTNPNGSVQKFAFHGEQHKIAFHQFTRCCTVALRNGTAQARCERQTLQK